MNEHIEKAEAVPLPQPRPLSAPERALVNWFLNRPVDHSGLRAQAAGAWVVATCSCGCPSVHLEVPPGVPAAPLVSDDPEVRHGVDASFTAKAITADRRELDVILHVIAGRLVELEIWAGTFGGDRRTELPDVSTLTR